MTRGEDSVFRALADPNRRKILDLVRDRPGIHINELTEHLPFSRFATMKHLRILEEAKLILSKKDWKVRKLYLNAIPIQKICDRCVSEYSRHWARGLNQVKKLMEEES